MGKTKYPILMVPGLIIKDLWFYKPIKKIADSLRAEGFTIYVAKVDGVGKIETNAVELKEQVLKILKKENIDKINLMAYSKGGLDCKYMMEELDMGEKVASFTAVCVPFKGSYFSTRVVECPAFIVWCAKIGFNVFYKLHGDKHPDSLGACKQTVRIDTDEETVLKVPGVYVQSYSSQLNDCHGGNLIMRIAYKLSKRHFKDEITDGFLEINSTKIGEYKGNITDESISHMQVANFTIHGEKKKKLFAFYKKLCNELEENGF